MTVAELITELQKLDPSLDVTVEACGNGRFECRMCSEHLVECVWKINRQDDRPNLSPQTAKTLTP